MHPTVSIAKCEVRNANVRDTASADEDAVELEKNIVKIPTRMFVYNKGSRVFPEVSLWF